MMLYAQKHALSLEGNHMYRRCFITAVLVALLGGCSSSSVPSAAPLALTAQLVQTEVPGTAVAMMTPPATVLMNTSVASEPRQSTVTLTATLSALTPGNSPVSDQYELTDKDNGKTFVYTVTSRFSVVLDAARYPVQAIHCTPDGIIGTITNLPSVAPPLAARRFQGVQPGQCELRNGDWSVMIVIRPGQ